MIPLLLTTALAAPPLQPDRRGAFLPDRSFDIEALHLDLDLSPAAGAVAGTATFTLRRLMDGPLVLDQVDLNIQDVHSGEQELTWWEEGDTLKIDVPEDITTLTIAYSATPQTGLHFRYAGKVDDYDEVWSQGEDIDSRHWFPSWDHPGDRFIYTGDIRAPEGWKVLTNSGMEVVNYLVMVAAGPYAVHTHPEDETISVWVPPGTSQAAIDQVLLPIPAMMAHFAARTGVDYAWGPYRQIFVQRFLYGGMENTSATVQTRRMLQGEQVAQTTGEWIERIMAHELAHQWYGDLLTCRDFRELWLNEGFASFMASDWMASQRGAAAWADSVMYWFAHARTVGAVAGRFYQGPDAPANSGVYVKGAATLQMLKTLLGEDVFWEGIRHYTTTHRNQLVSTHHLQQAMEEVSGQNLDWFFQQWIELPHVPSLTVSHAFSPDALTVTIRQEIGEQSPRYTLPITVEVGTADGGVQRVQGWLEDEALTLSLPLEEPPRYVAFDPDGGVLAVIEQEQTDAAWTAQLSSPSAYARRLAIDALADTDTSAPLAALLADTAAPLHERLAAAEALGEQRAAEPLIAALSDAHAGVREAAAEALQVGTDTASVQALEQRVRKDKDPNVRAAALRALHKRAPLQALDQARRLTRATSTQTLQLAEAAIDVIGLEGSAGDLALLRGEHPERLAEHAALAIAACVSRLEGKEKLKQQATRELESKLRSVDVRLRRSAAVALGIIGDRDSIPPLEQRVRIENDPHTRDIIEATLQKLHEGAPAEKGTGTMEGELEALESRLKLLEGRLEELEQQ